MPTKEGALFSSNRDESPLRQLAQKPTIVKNSSSEILCPTDTAAGGTWIGVNDKGVVIILLNGAFVKHKRQQSYRKSRGLIVKELLFDATPVDTWKKIDLQNIEPFTLIVWENGLHELVWDGEEKFVKMYSINEPHIWSSSTLYDTTAKELRNKWFNEWVQTNPEPLANNIRHLLLSHADEENGFVMNRNGVVKTLSISTIEVNKEKSVYEYYELINGELSTTEIALTQSNNSSASVKKVVAGKIH